MQTLTHDAHELCASIHIHILLTGCGRCKMLICAHICAHSVWGAQYEYTHTGHPLYYTNSRGACGVFKSLNCRLSVWFYYV